jgi:N-acetylglucosaminyldiphosphoundecaprenol N-acetyl-beta-D-mannosaminyltransferase
MIGTVLVKANVLGLGVTLGSSEAILNAVREAVASRAHGRTVCAINAHTFTEAQRNPRYLRALNAADIAFVDGVPVRWLLRLTGYEPPPRIHGADLTLFLLSNLPEARHVFFGSTPDTLARLRRSLLQRFPRLRIADMISPPFRRSAGREDPPLLHRLNQSRADLLWVGLGAPKQEMWMRLNAEALQVPVCIGVGAAFDILAGRFSRGPRWLQARGMEWVWRLLQDPARLWRRYFSSNGRFLATLLGQSVRRLRGNGLTAGRDQ